MAVENKGISELSSIESVKDGLIIVKNGKFRLVHPLDHGEIVIKYQDSQPILINKSEMVKL